MTDVERPTLFVPALGGLYGWLSGYAYPIFRFAMGVALVPHGLHDFGVLKAPPVLATYAQVLGSGWMTYFGLLEIIGGGCIAIGLLTRFFAMQVIVFLAVALIAVHLPNGYFWTGRGWELPLSWLVFFVFILIQGGGRCSIDRAIGREI
jgi:putative oxidoreductase